MRSVKLQLFLCMSNEYEKKDVFGNYRTQYSTDDEAGGSFFVAVLFRYVIVVLMTLVVAVMSAVTVVSVITVVFVITIMLVVTVMLVVAVVSVIAV